MPEALLVYRGPLFAFYAVGYCTALPLFRLPACRCLLFAINRYTIIRQKSGIPITYYNLFWLNSDQKRPFRANLGVCHILIYIVYGLTFVLRVFKPLT